MPEGSHEQSGAARSMLLIIYMIATAGITSATRWGVAGCANSITATVTMTKSSSGARKRQIMSSKEQLGAAKAQPGVAMGQEGVARCSQEQP